jgi:hypothetical protein
MQVVYLVSLSSKLEVRSLNNSINRTSLLAEPTVNTFGHVNVISARQTNHQNTDKA